MAKEKTLPDASLSDRLRYRALAFEGAPLGKLMIEAAEFIEASEKKKKT